MYVYRNIMLILLYKLSLARYFCANKVTLNYRKRCCRIITQRYSRLYYESDGNYRGVITYCSCPVLFS